MEIVKLKLSQIKPYDKNPRKNDSAVDAVVESIKQVGYCQPILVDENNVILAGHTRYKALTKLGWSEAEVVVRAGLTEDQKKKYRLLDNKTNEFATWDYDLLEKELEGLDFSGFDFGFNFSFSSNKNGFTPVQQPEYVDPEYTDDDGFEDYQNPLTKEELNEYAESADSFLAKKRVIITYSADQEEQLKNLLGITDENVRVVYNLEDLIGVDEE